MSRGKEVWAKIEPSFILGRSPAGQAFCSMSLAHQAVYLRLWCLCIETRTLRHRCVGAASALLSRNVGVSQRTLRSFLDVAPKQLVKVGEFVEVLGVYEHHKGLAFRDLPQTGNERGSNDPCLGENRVVELRVRVKPPLPPPTHPGTDPGTNPEPRQAGGRAGSVISEPQPRQEPQPPEAGQAGHGLEAEPQAPVAAESQPAEAQPHGHGEAHPQGVPEAGAHAPEPGQRPEPAAQAAPEPPGFDERWQEFLRRFPAVERKAIGRHAIRERADAIGRPFDALLAQVAEVCEDEEAGRVKIERSPLALACSRLRSGRGLKNGTLGKVRLALGLALPDTTAKKRDPEPLAASIAPSGPPPSQRQLQSALERLERSGQTAAAEQIRRMLERQQESACAR